MELLELVLTLKQDRGAKEVMCDLSTFVENNGIENVWNEVLTFIDEQEIFSTPRHRYNLTEPTLLGENFYKVKNVRWQKEYPTIIDSIKLYNMEGQLVSKIF